MLKVVLLKELLDPETTMSTDDAVSRLQPYLAMAVTVNFARRVLHAARAQRSEGMELRYTQIEGFAALVNASGVGHVTVTTCTGVELRAVLKARMKVDHESTQKGKPKAEKTQWKDVETAADEKLTALGLEDAGKYFRAWTFQSAAVRHGLTLVHFSASPLTTLTTQNPANGHLPLTVTSTHGELKSGLV